MAAWVAFYRLPPEVYWNLNPDELAAFDRYREKWQQANK
jgi:hypothetical protein